MNINKNNIDKCRLCLIECDESDLTPIFTGTETIGISLATRIMICLSLPVQAKDSFPNCVCKNCEKRVTQFYAFRENCLNAYYSLLGRTIVYDEEINNYCDRDENFRENANSRTDRSDKVRFDESELNSEQNTPESYVVCIDHRSAENYNQKTFVPDANSNSNFERISPHSQEARKLEEIVTSISSQADICTENLPHSSNDRTLEEPATEDKVSGEIGTENEPTIIRYKCLRCDNLFADLDTASIHCGQCSRADNYEFPERTAETVEYSDENFLEKSENCEKSNEIPIEELSMSSRDENSPNETRIQRRTNSMIAIRTDSKISRSESSSNGGKKKTRPIKSVHSCKDCDSIFSSAALLRRHSVVHTGERPYECPICKKCFSQLGQLNFHKNFHDNPRYRCEICKKPFLRPSDIAKHMRTHTGEKPYDCNVCSKSFAQLVALQQHERVHTGDKPYVCEICDKRFSQKANKTKHLKIHKEGAKPYTCAVCGRSFSDMEEMNLHEAGHGGGKPRKCDYCEMSFRKISELSQHTRRYHTFEKPHKCAFCKKAFYSLYNLKQHVMVHTGQKPYACSCCDLKFTQKGNLTKHYERKHGKRASNEDKYSVVKMKEEEEDCDRMKEREIWMLANDLLKNTNDSLIIEREETVEVETLEENIG